MLREEGLVRLWSGVSMAVGRAVLMTVGQLSCYDQIKAFLIKTPYFDDNVALHVVSSLMAVRLFLYIQHFRVTSI